MSQLTLISKEPINKGWSCDKKYCVTADDGVKYLLRVTPEEKSENRVEMFRMMQQLAALDISMCKPVEVGKCNQDVYIIESWIEGRNAGEVIPDLTEKEQYNLGLEAGRILKVIHSIPAPENHFDWEIRFNEKSIVKLRCIMSVPLNWTEQKILSLI